MNWKDRVNIIRVIVVGIGVLLAYQRIQRREREGQVNGAPAS